MQIFTKHSKRIRHRQVQESYSESYNPTNDNRHPLDTSHTFKQTNIHNHQKTLRQTPTHTLKPILSYIQTERKTQTRYNKNHVEKEKLTQSTEEVVSLIAHETTRKVYTIRRKNKENWFCNQTRSLCANSAASSNQVWKALPTKCSYFFEHKILKLDEIWQIGKHFTPTLNWEYFHQLNTNNLWDCLLRNFSMMKTFQNNDELSTSIFCVKV